MTRTGAPKGLCASRRLAMSIACCAFAGCYASHVRESPAETCDAPIDPACTAWEPAGPAMLVSDEGRGEGVGLTSTVASGCGVMIAWYRLSGRPSAETLTFSTRAIDWDGAPSAPLEAHPALSLASNASALFDLAVNGGSIGAITSSLPGGCRFVPLDARGVDRGPPVPVADGCSSLARLGDGYSFLSVSLNGATPGALVTLDAMGLGSTRTPLAVAPGRSLWSRTTLEDGTFLAYSFSEDPATTVYTGWLQHFGAHGEVLAPELEIGAGSVPVFFAASPRGAVTLWRGRTPTEARLHARSVDRDGNPDGAVRDLPAEGQLYELALTSRSDGEALVLFLEHHDDTMPNAWLLRAQALAPDATARGEPTLLLSGENTTSLRVLMEESGSRALVLYDGDGVRALPLRCVGR